MSTTGWLANYSSDYRCLSVGITPLDEPKLIQPSHHQFFFRSENEGNTIIALQVPNDRIKWQTEVL